VVFLTHGTVKYEVLSSCNCDNIFFCSIWVIIFPKLTDFMVQGYSWEFIVVQLANNLLVLYGMWN